jgi:hypothetical protein
VNGHARSGWGARANGTLIGLGGVVLLSAAMLPLRGHLHNVFMALVLVVPVLIGAFTGGRVAGVVSAVAATLAFDFFFTQPYLSLRIATRNDTAAAIALLLLATVASELGNRLRKIDRTARTERAMFERLCRVVEISARGSDVDDVVSSVRAEIMGMFDLDECIFEPADSTSNGLRLDLDGSVAGTPADRTSGYLVLPPGGVVVPVTGRGRDYGRLVLYANRPLRVSPLERRIAMSIAEELGLTLATQSVNGDS